MSDFLRDLHLASTPVLRRSNRGLDQLLERGPSLVERRPYDDAYDALDLREGGDVLRVPHPTAGDGGHDAGDRGGLIDRSPALRAVPGDIRVENGLHAVGRELPRELQHPDPARRSPAVRGDDTFARIYGDDEVGSELLYSAPPELGVSHRSRADHYPARAGAPHRLQIPQGADPTPCLHRHPDGARYLPNEAELRGAALAGSVEIHDVERLSPAPLPPAGTLDGVCVVLPSPPEVSLLEPHAPAPSQVYGGEDGKAPHELRAHLKKFS